MAVLVLQFASDAWTDFVRDCQTFQGSEVVSPHLDLFRLKFRAACLCLSAPQGSRNAHATLLHQTPQQVDSRRQRLVCTCKPPELLHSQAGVTGRRRRLTAEAEGEGATVAQLPNTAGRRRRRLAAEGGEGEAGEGATAAQPSATDRVGCFPPFTKWQDFEVWLAITDKGASPCLQKWACSGAVPWTYPETESK